MAANAERQRSEKRSRSIGAPAPEQPSNGTLPGSGQPMMDLAFLRGLIDAVDQSGIDSLEIHRAGTRIRIAKTPPPAPVNTLASSALMAQHAAAAIPPAAAPSTVVSAAAETAAEAPASHLVEIKSPMVGTFYRSPAPEAPAYVEIGSQVSKGQTLCILEAMKLMNELESEVDGIVREVLVDNADPVEYGQVLFRIEPAGR
jgi:acetyl-CoA carboxylase biotin carboxyl carrier protein